MADPTVEMVSMIISGNEYAKVCHIPFQNLSYRP
jgi:hypothetical protein